MSDSRCKICSHDTLEHFAHTAKCSACGTLLHFPYPPDDNALVATGEGKADYNALEWYSASSFLNHHNFTDMLRFAMDESCKGKPLNILDFGGGGGQFALVCSSHFPEANVYITDINDDALLKGWRPINNQIPFSDFTNDATQFDFIFMNDVFEHVSDPAGVLKTLSDKLTPGGKIFIDTPKQFWIYPFAKYFSKNLYAKVLRGTVSTSHLQIWTKKSFEWVVKKCGLKIIKYKTVSEYTMPAAFYLKNMGIKNPLFRFAANVFYRFAKYLANNKIMAVLEKQ